MKSNRRNFLGKGLAAATAGAALGGKKAAAQDSAPGTWTKKVIHRNGKARRLAGLSQLMHTTSVGLRKWRECPMTT